MPGVYGIACSAPSDDLTSRLGMMSAPLWHHDWYQEAKHVDETGIAGFGRVSTGQANGGSPLAVNKTGRLVGVLEGEIYDYAEQRQSLERSGCKFVTGSHAELLLHGFEHSGAKFLRGLHGKYAAVIWNASARKLHLVNDRFGMKPLYFRQANGRLSFSSEVKSLLVDAENTRQVNWRGLAQFFTFGQLLGEDTLHEGVRLLPAAGVLTYHLDSDRTEFDAYWRLPATQSHHSEAESLDRIDSAFAASVARMTNQADGLGISLSGGLDARTILGVFGPGRSLTSLSLGMPGSMDHVSATSMAKLLGYQHHQVMLGDEFLTEFESHLRRMVRLTDGQYLCQCIVMPTLPVYRELGVRVLLRGHAGELMHMTKAYSFSLDRSALKIQTDDAMMDWLWQHLQAFMLGGIGSQLFSPRIRSTIRDQARDSLEECYTKTSAAVTPQHRVWQLFLEQRLRRETALSLSEFESVVETRLPYLDNELIEELFAAPMSIKLDDTIQTLILQRCRPELLRVVNVNTGTRLGAGRFTKWAGKMRRRVLSKLGVNGYQPYERLGLWLRRELRPLVRRLLLEDRCLERGIFDPNTIRTVVEDHLNRQANHTYLLLALMIFEVGQQDFVDGRKLSPQLAVAV